MAAPFQPESAIARLEAMAVERSTFESHWEEVRKVTWPIATEFTSTAVRGAKLHKDVFDGSAENTTDLLASALFGLAYNPATRWLGLVTRDKSLMRRADVADWLEIATNVHLDIINAPATRFATEQYSKLAQFVAFGTGPQFIAEHARGPLFQTMPLAQCFIGEDEWGVVDTLYRRFPWSARLCVKRWGTANVGPEILKKFNDPEQADRLDVTVLHVVEPRGDAERDPSKIDVRNKRWREAFIAVDHKHTMHESGYDEFPYVVPRLNPRPGEVYGRGRGMTALADTKMLMRSMKATIRGVEKRTDPVMLVADDGVMSPMRWSPGGSIRVRADMLRHAGGGVRALETGAEPDMGERFNAAIRDRIDRAHWLPILQAFTDPKMTATQVLKLDEQTLRFVGPILGRLQSEDAGPMIERVFPILLRGGHLPPPPAILEGQPIDVEYVSPIAKAQRLEEARGWAETFELLDPWRQAHPEVDDNFDGDRGARGIAELRSVPRAWMRDADGVSEIRAERARAREEAEANESFIRGAGGAAKLIDADTRAGEGVGAAA